MLWRRSVVGTVLLVLGLCLAARSDEPIGNLDWAEGAKQGERPPGRLRPYVGTGFWTMSKCDQWDESDGLKCSGDRLWLLRVDGGFVLSILQRPFAGGVVLDVGIKAEAGFGFLLNEGDDLGDRAMLPLLGGLRLGVTPPTGQWHGVSPYIEAGLGVLLADSWFIADDTVKPLILFGLGVSLPRAETSRRVQIAYEHLTIRNAYLDSWCTYVPPYYCEDVELSHSMHSLSIGIVF